MSRLESSQNEKHGVRVSVVYAVSSARLATKQDTIRETSCPASGYRVLTHTSASPSDEFLPKSNNEDERVSYSLLCELRRLRTWLSIWNLKQKTRVRRDRQE